jgi:hemerythrin-like domain-containing protein
MDTEARRTRRDFLVAAGTAGAGLLLAGCRGIAGRAQEKEVEEGEEGVTATEDLMREHGVLERILLIYEEGIRRIEAHDALLPEDLFGAAMIVRAFVEDYHEKQEESDVFPRLEKASRLAPLTAILRAQHKAGRNLTDGILKRLQPEPFNVPESRRELAALMRSFARMYRPHYAREDTVVFPALRAVTPPEEFAKLADRFEDRERETLGPEGFEKAVASVAQIEEAMGIADLAQFTPKEAQSEK